MQKFKDIIQKNSESSLSIKADPAAAKSPELRAAVRKSAQDPAHLPAQSSFYQDKIYKSCVKMLSKDY
jgi:hypothetical protein